MNWEAFITCAVTGAGDTTGRSDKVPVTPARIAESAIEAATAGAAIVHIHVRDPATGRGSRDPALYRETVERIRSSGVDVVLNLTAGMGGDLVLGGDESPLPLDASGTDMVGATERLAHVEDLLPDLAASSRLYMRMLMSFLAGSFTPEVYAGAQAGVARLPANI